MGVGADRGLLAAATVGALAWFFVLQSRPRLADQAAFLGSEEGSTRLEPITQFITGVVSVPFLVIAVVAAAAVALVGRRWGDAVRAVVLVGGANLTTQLLKISLERPVDAGLPDANYGNSLPSGHTTVAASIAAAALIVAPRRARPVVALLGGLYAAVMGVATMSLGWHRPSDAIAAFAVVAAWSLLLLVPNSGRTVPAGLAPGGRTVCAALLATIAFVGIGVGVVTLALALGLSTGSFETSQTLFSETWERTAFLGSAAAVAGASALVSWGMLLARR